MIEPIVMLKLLYCTALYTQAQLYLYSTTLNSIRPGVRAHMSTSI